MGFQVLDFFFLGGGQGRGYRNHKAPFLETVSFLCYNFSELLMFVPVPGRKK